MISPVDFSPAGRPSRRESGGAGRAAGSGEGALHDAELVGRFNAGDEAAFAEITIRYRERMSCVAYGVLKNRADAEEIAQETFVRAHRGLGGFRGDSSLATWLHRIAVNLARNRYWYYFRRGRHATISLDCPFSEDNQASFSEVVATSAAGPAREAEASEFSQLVTDCMNQLGEQSREILTQCNSLNRSYEEIARELGISLGTVKSRISRAREKLRGLLASAYPEFGPDAEPATWFETIRTSAGVAVL